MKTTTVEIILFIIYFDIYYQYKKCNSFILILIKIIFILYLEIEYNNFKNIYVSFIYKLESFLFNWSAWMNWLLVFFFFYCFPFDQHFYLFFFFSTVEKKLWHHRLNFLFFIFNLFIIISFSSLSRYFYCFRTLSLKHFFQLNVITIYALIFSKNLVLFSKNLLSELWHMGLFHGSTIYKAD